MQKEISAETEKFLEDVKQLRLKFPVAHIAKKTGFSKSNVSEYLSGKKEPSEKFLQKFYEVYKIDKHEITIPELTTTILNIYAMNKVILSGIAEVIAKQTNKPATLLKDQLEEAVKLQQAEIEKLFSI